MGIWRRLRKAKQRKFGEAGLGQAPEPDPEAAPSWRVEEARGTPPRVGPQGLARYLHVEHPDGVPSDVLFDRAEAAGLEPQEVDQALDDIQETARVSMRRVRVSALRVVDLTSLESVRTRIKGSAYCVTDSDRRRYGGPEYLLIREPDNEVDPSAVAVYGKGRRVGFLSAARAASLAPLLDELDADAFLVTGTATTPSSIVLWVDAPRVGALRKYVQAHR